MPLPDNAAIEAQIYKAIGIVKPSLATAPLTPETRFMSLGLQSIEVISVAFEMEDAFGISIVDRQLDNFRTIADAREVVRQLLSEKEAA